MAFHIPGLPNSSEDFVIVEYLLQMQLGSSQFKATQISDITPRTQTNEFNNFVKKMKNANVVDVFIPLENIEQPLSDIARHGVRVPAKTGLKFQTNKLTLNHIQDKYEVIHLIVALGHTYNHQNVFSTLREVDYIQESPTIADLPKGYDSLRLSNHNEFVIFKSGQIKTAHYIQFEGGDNLTEIPNVLNVCGVCGQHNATLYCEQDSIKLCESCDQATHSTNPLFQTHTRIALRQALSNNQRCPEHPGSIVKYYCPKCHVPVCVECKINGSHSKSETNKHKLVPIDQAYNGAHDNVNSINPTYVTREKYINQKLSHCNAKLNEICDNADAVEKELTRLYNEALRNLREESGKRAAMYKSAIVELERKKDELKTQERFIKLHDSTSEPLDFLRYYSSSKVLEREMQIGKDLPQDPSANGDLAVFGTLSISTPQEWMDLNRTHTTSVIGTESSHKTKEVSETETETETKTITESAPTQIEPKQVKCSHLSRIAERKEKKLAEQNLKLSFQPFQGSEILTNEEHCRILYLCLPFKGLPETHLMFSTSRDGRSMNKCHKLVDNMGITAVVVKVDDYIFGGFAATKWNNHGKPFGENASCFLFQLNKDVMIPYKPQSDQPCKLYASQDTISFGYDDLKFSDNFDDCKSIIENSYGLGYIFNGEVAKTYMAGKPTFKPDVVEIWGFFTPE